MTKVEIRDEKIQHNINTEAAKTSVLTSDKIDKYDYFTREGILCYGPVTQLVEQDKFTYTSQEKVFEKQRKRTEDVGKN